MWKNAYFFLSSCLADLAYLYSSKLKIKAKEVKLLQQDDVAVDSISFWFDVWVKKMFSGGNYFKLMILNVLTNL